MLERNSKVSATMRANAVVGKGTWTLEEIERFQAAWRRNVRSFQDLEKAVGTRKASQVKSFAQKFLDKHPPSTWATPVAPLDAATPRVALRAVRMQGAVVQPKGVDSLLEALQNLRMGRDDNNAKFDEIVASLTAQVEAAMVSDAVGSDDAAGAAAGPSPVVEPPRQSSRQRTASSRARDAAEARALEAAADVMDA